MAITFVTIVSVVLTRACWGEPEAQAAYHQRQRLLEMTLEFSRVAIAMWRCHLPFALYLGSGLS